MGPTAPPLIPPVISPIASNNIPVATNITYLLEQDLEDLLRSYFIVKPADTHEVLEALNHDNTIAWKRFIRLDDEDINALSQHTSARSGSNRAPIATKYKKELMSFRGMISERRENIIPGAKDISSYDVGDIEDYYNKHAKDLQANTISQVVTLSPASTLAPTPPRYVKSKWEKELDNWTRGKRDKTQFPILHDNSEYITWNEKFIAECNVQKLSNMVNVGYKLDYSDPFEEELYTYGVSY